LIQVTSFTLLKDNKKVRVELSDSFILLMREKIFSKFKSINKFSKIIGFSKDKVTFWLTTKKHRSNIPVPYLLIVLHHLDIDLELALKQITNFSTQGCHTTATLPQKIDINEQLIIGIGLYVGDGYTSKKLPRIVFINSDPGLISFFFHWIKRNFRVHENELYASVYTSQHDMQRFLNILHGLNIRCKFYKNKKPHHKTCCKLHFDNAVYRYLLDSLITLIQDLCLKRKAFAIEYLKGIFAAEGCIYLSKRRSPQLFIEMHIGKNIDHVGQLFNFLNITHKVYARPLQRKKISVYRKEQLKRLRHLNLFEIYPQKKEKLDIASMNYPLNRKF